MRHRKKFNHLSRTSSHREAMLANMACSLIMCKRITTTVAKAKALKIYAEPIMTKAKNVFDAADQTAARRLAFAILRQKEAVTELFTEIAPKIATRPGGYTRILHLGKRYSDNSEMCIIELVDYNTTYVNEKKEVKKAGTRRSRAKKAEVATESVEEATVVETPAAE